MGAVVVCCGKSNDCANSSWVWQPTVSLPAGQGKLLSVPTSSRVLPDMKGQWVKLLVWIHAIRNTISDKVLPHTWWQWQSENNIFQNNIGSFQTLNTVHFPVDIILCLAVTAWLNSICCTAQTVECGWTYYKWNSPAWANTLVTGGHFNPFHHYKPPQHQDC